MVVVLDKNAIVFTRIWCGFEQATVVQGKKLLLDFATVHEGEEALKSSGANVSARSHLSAEAASLASSPSAVDVMLKQCSISTLQGVPVARSTALAAASHAAADATPRRKTRAGVPCRSAVVSAVCTSSAMSGSLATVRGLWRICAARSLLAGALFAL